MRYKLFGPTGLRVSEMCLGVMTFGEAWGWGSSKDESKQVFDAFVAAGGNFFDTANFYTNGESERILGEFISPNRHDYVIGTKYTLTSNPDDPNAGGNQRKNLFRSIDESLQRLGTDYIDVYWVHVWDFMTPVEEVMRGLDDVVRMGKVLYVGISDAPAWYIAEANTLADCRGWTPFAGLQMQYSLTERTIEREILPFARAHGLLTTAWSPLSGGMLTGKYGAGSERTTAEGSRLADGGMVDHYLTDRNFEIAAVVQAVAEESDRSMAQVALAWLRHADPDIVPIIGARSVGQLDENLASLDLELDNEQCERLDAVSRIDPGFPATLLSRAANAVYGNTRERIDTGRYRSGGSLLHGDNDETSA
jgi:aryl-alcohol dehydrogenase-like predicted oxidoreductase